MNRFLTSGKSIMLLLMFVLVGSLFVALYFEPSQFPKSRVNVFLSILASVTVILIGLSLAVTAVTLHEAEIVIRTYGTKQAIDTLWLYPNRLLSQSLNARDEFLKSFYQNNPYLQKAVNQRPSVSSTTSILEEQTIAIVMIQAWEDFLTMSHIDLTGDEVWLNNFVQWAQSPFLREYYDFLKYNFKSTTRELAEVLFAYGAKIPTHSPEAYRKTVLEMIQDPAYQRLKGTLVSIKKNPNID